MSVLIIVIIMSFWNGKTIRKNENKNTTFDKPLAAKYTIK